MSDRISCSCGYTGPSVTQDGVLLCPICRAASTPAGPRDEASRPEPRPTPPPAYQLSQETDPLPPGGFAQGSRSGGLAPPPPPGARVQPGFSSPRGESLAGLPAAGPAEEVWHIPCPNGHRLPVGEAVIGQEVVCPRCNEFFTARKSDSIEYQRQKEAAEQRRLAKQAKRWLQIAITAVVIVVLSLVGMIVVSFFR
jgi:uncharacterized Zn finger protein (UPF0148 family)